MAAPVRVRSAPASSPSQAGSFDTAMGRLENKSGSERLVAYATLNRFGTLEEFAALLAFLRLQ
jgi:hypothetical protein